MRFYCVSGLAIQAARCVCLGAVMQSLASQTPVQPWFAAQQRGVWTTRVLPQVQLVLLGYWSIYRIREGWCGGGKEDKSIVLALCEAKRRRTR